MMKWMVVKNARRCQLLAREGEDEEAKRFLRTKQRDSCSV